MLSYSWSPDGAHLLCANAMSGPVFVASVIKREDWSSDIYLVGHENSVVVTVSAALPYFCFPLMHYAGVFPVFVL